MKENAIKISITDRQGLVHNVAAPTTMNLNIMEVCKASDLPVKGTCGGAAACASCHIYVLSENIRLNELSEAEENMLDSAFFVEDNSRLACQIYLTNAIDGLKIQLAPED